MQYGVIESPVTRPTFCCDPASTKDGGLVQKSAEVPRLLVIDEAVLMLG